MPSPSQTLGCARVRVPFRFPPRSRVKLGRTIRLCALSLAILAVGHAVANPITPDEVLMGQRSGQVIVRPLKSPLTGRALREISARSKVGGWVERKFPSLGGLQVIGLPKGVSVDRALAELRASGVYEYAEPDYIVRANATPNDPDYANGRQWGLNNLGQNNGVSDADIDAPEGWDSRTDASGVIMAFIDSGVRYTHEDIAANMWRNPGESGDGKETNGIDDDNNGYVDDVFGINAITGTGNPMDDNGHGTHVAGTAGAVGNNGLGGSGVAWKASIMACKFLDATGSGSVSDAIKCIDYARQHGAKVMSNSWGGSGFSQALLDAIRSAGEAGAIFVAAAGNSAANITSAPSYPAAYQAENVITVAGTARDDGLYSSTNYGFGIVDVAAPGQEIYSTYGSADNAYAWMSGTSMATPHVSAIAALLCSQFPSDTPRQTINRILRSTKPTAALAGKTTLGGRVNLALALNSTSSAPFNDAFADASTIPVFPATIRTSNRGASSEAGEPSHAGVAPENTLWWKWVAVTTGEVQLSSTGSAFDSVLAVYSGENLASLAPIAANDDSGAGVTTSSLRFQASAGTTYYFVLGGKTASAVGLVNLTLSAPPQPPPSNDNFSARQTLSGSANLVIASNVSATSEPDEPLNTSESGGHSVWWEWTAPSAGRVEIITWNSDFDTTLGVYSGSALDSLTALDQNDDVIGGFIRTSRTVLTTEAGEKYQISVDGWAEETGTIFLWLTMGETPPNDNFASAAQLPPPSVTATGARTSANGTTNWAGREPGEPDHAGRNGISSIWWNWTAPASGPVTIDTNNSDFYAVLAIYQGSSVDALSLVAADEPDSVQSHLTFNATAGQIYRIAVDGYERSAGDVSLQLGLQNSRPSVTAATVLPSGSAFDDQSLSVSSPSAADPEHDSITLSYQWQSSVDGTTFADASGEIAPVLPVNNSRSGKFWRCRIVASDALGEGAPWFTSAVALDNRPPSTALDAQPFTYDCDLPGTGAFAVLSGAEIPAGLTLDPLTGELSGTISEPSGGLFHIRLGRDGLERSFDLLVGTSQGVYRIPAGRTWIPSGPVSITGQLLVDGSVADGAQVTLTQTYSAWRAAWFGAPVNPTANSDQDGDGLNDFAEFAFGGNPLVPDASHQAPKAGAGSTFGSATITFRRQKSPSLVVYSVERSSNLVDWTLVDPVANIVGTPTPSGREFEVLTVQDPGPLSGAPSFLRVRTGIAP